MNYHNGNYFSIDVITANPQWEQQIPSMYLSFPQWQFKSCFSHLRNYRKPTMGILSFPNTINGFAIAKMEI